MYFLYFADTQPFMVAVYQGVEKPTTTELIGEVVEELKRLKFDDPTVATARGFYVKLRQVCADRPAHSTLKCITNASGYCSCERCQTFGMAGEAAKVSRNIAVRPAPDAAAAPAAAAPAPSASATHANHLRKALKRLQPKPRRAPPSETHRSSAEDDDGFSSTRNQRRPTRRRAAAVRASQTIKRHQQASETVNREEETAAASTSRKKKEEGISTNVVFPEMNAPPRAYSEWPSYMIGVRGGPDGKLVSLSSDKITF